MIKLDERANLVRLAKALAKEEIFIKIKKELSIYEDHEGHINRQNYSEPYWLGYVQCLKNTIKLLEIKDGYNTVVK